jgi:hypothetical protein
MFMHEPQIRLKIRRALMQANVNQAVSGHEIHRAARAATMSPAMVETAANPFHLRPTTRCPLASH